MNFEKLRKHSIDNLGEGNNESDIQKLEVSLSIKIPNEYRNFLLSIGYAEIYGEEIYSIYSIPDKTPCMGLHWMNIRNENLKDGYIEFFSNDLDGVFYMNELNGKVYINNKNDLYADSFIKFCEKMIDN